MIITSCRSFSIVDRCAAHEVLGDRNEDGGEMRSHWARFRDMCSHTQTHAHTHKQASLSTAV